jgi:hypothetical protein
VTAVDHAEALRALLDEPLVVGDDRKRVADERPAVVTGNMGEAFSGRAHRAVGGRAPRIEGLYRHGATPAGDFQIAPRLACSARHAPLYFA